MTRVAYNRIAQPISDNEASNAPPPLAPHPAGAPALRRGPDARGWAPWVARHTRVITSLTGHLNRLAQSDQPRTAT